MKPEIENQYLEVPTTTGEVIRVLRKSHPQARRLRLTITSGGARVTCPKGTHSTQVLAFLRQHGDWLAQKLDELRLVTPLPALQLGTTVVIPLRGESVRLCWREGPFPRIELIGDRLRLTLPQPHRRALETARGLLHSHLEAQLRKDVSRWLALYCPRIGIAPTVVRVRALKTLWGSLDTRDRVNLDLALALAPPAALRYVLVHELCHLRIRNHSPRYWALVESILPRWKDQREWLRINGQALKAELARLILAP